jgi:hypothetical protein
MGDTEMGLDGLTRLQSWYAQQCDGDWEHQWGIMVDTPDNPGWSLKVDLWGTDLSELNLAWTRIERTDEDWLFYGASNGLFEAAAGPRNLSEAIDVFLALTPTSGPQFA